MCEVPDFLTKYFSVYFSGCRKHKCSLNCVFFLWKSVTNPWFLVSWKLKKMIIKLLERSWKSPWICSGWPCRNPFLYQVKNLSSQLVHWELTLKHTESSFWGHSVASQWTHEMTDTVSFLWVCNSHGELAVSYLWDHLVSSPCSGSSELTLRVTNS